MPVLVDKLCALHVSWLLTALVVPAIFVIEFGWYAHVALAFSSGRARDSYARGKRWIDRLAAGAMGLLGVKILAEALLN